MKVALQMYSLRSLTGDDFFGTLGETAKMGYDGVEFAGYFDVPAKELKAILDKNGLEAAGSHVSIDRLREDLDGEIAYAKELGLYSVVCPYADMNTEEEWIAFGRELNEIGKKFRANGILFGYHNHANEFQKQYNGTYALDLIFQNSDPENVFAEVDTYWVKKGGDCPVAYTKKYADRIPLLHAKDLDEAGKDMEVGTGCIDFQKVVDGLTNLKWIVVEQEEYNYPVLESVKIGCDNMKKWIGDRLFLSSPIFAIQS